MERQTYNDLYRPSYNIKAVAQMVGLLPVTLRAWERRYGLPTPSRGGQGYRLYSEHDLQTLRWLKSQVENGMNIGQAARKLAQLREAGIDPAIQEHLPTEKPLSLDNIRQTLITSLRSMNENRAAETLRQALALYPLEQVFSQAIKPVLIEIGDMWQQNELPVAIEHFASGFFQKQLLSLLNAAPDPYHNGLLLAGCLPGEEHQIGLLMLVVLLRFRGWNVIYLGANLILDRLEDVLATLHPRMLLFSATTTETARNAEQLYALVKKLPGSLPQVILGGQGFTDYPSERLSSNTIIVNHEEKTIREIEKILEA